MQDVYRQNSALGDPASLDPQLEENAQKLDHLQKEIAKYEVRRLALHSVSVESELAVEMTDTVCHYSLSHSSCASFVEVVNCSFVML